MKIKSLNSTSKDFYINLSKYLSLKVKNSEAIEYSVAQIINDLVKKKDRALINFSKKYDNVNYTKISDSIVSKKEIEDAYKLVPSSLLKNIKKAISNIKKFSKRQILNSWTIKQNGSTLGEKVTPIKKVGIYVPGGKASYPSTVVMNSVPAKTAGVDEITMVCPPTDGKLNPLVLVAANLCGVNKIYKFGGAHAIAALAYGTESIEPVDKIVGPGNIYVATAKKMVFGKVGIDSFAGPSEILIIADSYADPECIAIDMFAQAEHDEMAQSILLTTSSKLINAVNKKIDTMIKNQKRKKIINKSLVTRGLFIKAKNKSEIISIADTIAPEHLEILGYENFKLEKEIHNAGAIFIGESSPEVFGDYCAGPNHVLPTSGTARYASPLGVYDFLKRTSIMKISKTHAKELSQIASSIAECEGLYSHSESAKFRN
ncbi:MAG: histidinol dehydrogenase [Gammaproteobacteria bacterium]|nr:histidinol dehydrogenase [Gammaproteobacteria bacterium]MBL6818801.1 histidinol dehydrogenase [Gammaproteobacteria bacterium]MBL6899235.1 histidinol dehydrogenase [Gammaproteobacteria bacterium]